MGLITTWNEWLARTCASGAVSGAGEGGMDSRRDLYMDLFGAVRLATVGFSLYKGVSILLVR